MDDPDTFVRAAASLYCALRAKPEVLEALAGSTCYYEVPFSCVPPDRPGMILRGAVDCLVVRDDQAVILEFKTGAPRPEHGVQAALYAAAMRTALARNDVKYAIIYP